MLQATTLIFFPALMVYAALSDLFTMTISNRISLALIVVFPVFAVAAGMGGTEIALHVACGVGVLLVTFGMFAMNWIGGGDAKLAAATAVWVGFEHIGDFGLDTALIGGVLAAVIIYGRLMPLPRRLLGIGWLTRLHERDAGMPYGIALALAGLLIYPDTGVWSAAAAA